MTNTRKTTTRITLTVLLVIIALIATATPAAAKVQEDAGAPRTGRIFLTLVIVTPGNAPNAPTTADSETTTTESLPACPGHYAEAGPHPCPQTMRTGQDNAHAATAESAPIPAPTPEPTRRGQ